MTRIIWRVRRIYRDRRDYLLSHLELRLGDRLSVVPSFYGMHLTAIARENIDCDAVSKGLARGRIMVHSLSRYFLGAETRRGIILGYAAADFDSLQIAIRALAEEIG